MEIKEIICPICEKKTDIQLLDKGQFNLYLCQECKNGFIHPIPKNLSDYYPKIYWQHQGRFSKLRAWLHNSFQIERTRYLKKYLKRGEILDVGSGEGIFGKMLGNNFQVTNLEAPGAEVENRDVIKRDLLTWKTTKRFDGIVFLESLEHVDKPQKYLKKASELLNDGGYIFVEYPQFDSLESRLLGKNWLQRDIPRHLCHFTRKGLRIIAKRDGLKVVAEDGVLSYEYSPYCLVVSIMNILKIKPLNLRISSWNNVLILLILAVFGPLSFIFETFFYYINQFPIGLLILKKE